MNQRRKKQPLIVLVNSPLSPVQNRRFVNIRFRFLNEIKGRKDSLEGIRFGVLRFFDSNNLRNWRKEFLEKRRMETCYFRDVIVGVNDYNEFLILELLLRVSRIRMTFELFSFTSNRILSPQSPYAVKLAISDFLR